MEWRNEHGRLWRGDCLTLMQRIPAGCVGMVFADLPYGVTECKWDSVLPFEELWSAWGRVMKNGLATVLTATQPFAAACVMSKPEWFKHEWVWDKRMTSGGQNAEVKPLSQHELCLVFSIGGGRVSFKPIRTPRAKPIIGSPGPRIKALGTRKSELDRSERVYDEYYPRDILSIPAIREQGGHPTQKPVALVQYLIKTYSNPGDVVLDPTAGSGTTAIAAMNTGRRFVCIEKDPDIYAGMVARVEKHVKKLKNSLGALDR